VKSQKAEGDDGVTISPPDFSLKKTIGDGVDLRELFNEEVISQAQNNVALQQQSFLQWFSEDLDMLEHAYASLESQPHESEMQINNMNLIAISIKSQGGTFGYDLASEIARSLYIFLHDFSFSKGQCTVIRKHIDALQTILKQRINGTGGDIGKELLRDINRLTAKFRKPI
jgi:hypothetical protein